MRARQQTRPKNLFDLNQFYKDVGLRVRDARKGANNMTQKALAITVGLTRTSLTNIEKGRQKVLLHTFTDIASTLGVEIATLLPKKENLLNGLKVQLPSTLAPEERGFIERAIGVGGSYETTQTKDNRGKRSGIIGKAPLNRRAGKR